MRAVRRTVLVLSGHAAVRDGIAALLGPTGVEIQGSADYRVPPGWPDVALVDLDHAPIDTLSLVVQLRAQLEASFLVALGSPTRLAAAVVHSTDAELEAARADGRTLAGLLERTAPAPSRELVRAHRLWAEVTPRQRDVLRWLSDGHDNPTIADYLKVTDRAVKAHVTSLLALFGCRNRTHLAVLASRAGLRPTARLGGR